MLKTFDRSKAEDDGSAGGKERWRRVRKFYAQGPVALLDLLNADPIVIRPSSESEAAASLTAEVHRLWPEAPAIEPTLGWLLQAADPELAGMLEYVQLSSRGRNAVHPVECILRGARSVVDRERLELFDAALAGGPQTDLVQAFKSANDHGDRPARVLAQAVVHAIESAEDAWLKRVRRCGYAACDRPWYWDMSAAGTQRFCSRAHRTAEAPRPS
jgi:hypothetical protein